MASTGPLPAPTSQEDVRNEDEDTDDLLAQLEQEDDSTYRAQRLQELHRETTSSRPTQAFAKIDTAYVTLPNDDEVLRFTTEHERAVVHFFHADFSRCSTMDGHCQQIAAKHSEHGNADVSFGRVDVKNAPFVVEKLAIRVLPCVVGFTKGVAKGRVTGFEGLCWDGNEGAASVTRALEETFVDWTVLKKRLMFAHDDNDSTDDEDERAQSNKPSRGGIRSTTRRDADDDEDWD